MSQGKNKVVIVTSLSDFSLTGREDGRSFSELRIPFDRKREVFEYLKRFEHLSAWYLPADGNTLKLLLQAWSVPPNVPGPNWPLVWSGNEPPQAEKPVLDNDGDAIMCISQDSVVFYTLTAAA